MTEPPRLVGKGLALLRPPLPLARQPADEPVGRVHPLLRRLGVGLDALLEAGLTVPQVIALSELLAFACFQIRVAHGLSLLEENA